MPGPLDSLNDLLGGVTETFEDVVEPLVDAASDAGDALASGLTEFADSFGGMLEGLDLDPGEIQITEVEIPFLTDLLTAFQSLQERSQELLGIRDQIDLGSGMSLRERMSSSNTELMLDFIAALRAAGQAWVAVITALRVLIDNVPGGDAIYAMVIETDPRFEQWLDEAA